MVQENRKKAIALNLTATLCFGLMQVCVALTDKGIPIAEQLFFRNLLGLFIIGFLLHRLHIPYYGGNKKYYPYLLGRSAAGFIGVCLLFYGLRNAPQADVTIMNRLELFTVTAASAIFLHEKIGKVHILSMVLAFAGALVAVNPSFSSSFLVPFVSGFGVALCDSILYPIIAYLSDKVHPFSVVMSFCTLSTVASIPLMFGSFIMPQGKNLLYLLGIGFFAAIAQVSMTYSYRYAPASEMNIYNQLAILVNAFLGFIFLHQIPTIHTLIGGVIVVAASVMLFYQTGNKM